MAASRADSRHSDAVSPGAVASPASDGSLRAAYRALAILAALLVLVQAVLVGQGLYGGDLGLIGVHGWVGNAGFLVVIGLLVVAFIGRLRGGFGTGDVLLSGVLLLLMVAQLGLGYSGRRSTFAASWHIPNGVLIFGVLAAILALAFVPRGGRVVQG